MLAQTYLDIPGGVHTGQRLLHALAHLPDDGLRRLVLEWPLPTQQLIPHSPATNMVSLRIARLYLSA